MILDCKKRNVIEIVTRPVVLQRLSMRDMVVSGTNYFQLMFGTLTHLTHLDLSNCVHREGMSNFDWLSKYFSRPNSHLYYLVLHNVPGTNNSGLFNSPHHSKGTSDLKQNET